MATKTIKVIDLLKILLTQTGDIPEYIYFEDYKYEYDDRENDYFCDQLNYFLFMNILGENLENNLNLSIIIIEEEKEIEKIEFFEENLKSVVTKTTSGIDFALGDFVINTDKKINELIDAVNKMRKEK